MCFEGKLKSEMKLDTEHLLNLPHLKQMQYGEWIFFSDACRYCLTTTVRKFNDFNIGIVDAIQKKFVYLHEMGERIKSLLL